MAGSETQKSIGKRMASGRSIGRSRGGSSKLGPRYPLFALCVDNRGNEGSLRKGKVYQVVRPQPGDQAYDLRVIDEEGEDYLYSAEQFVILEGLKPKAKRAVQEAVPTGGR